MNKIVLFAGTTEGRLICEALRGKNVTVFVSVATEYGEEMIEEAENIEVRHGRKDTSEIADMLRETGAELVIDATHPYAAEVTKSLLEAAKATNTDYLRVLREVDHENTENCVFLDDTPSAVDYLNTVEGNILLTVGSKELSQYTAVSDYKTRVFARILPMPDAVSAAHELGFSGKNLICMQGPFTEEINTAMMRMLKIRYLVTKDTGAPGGFSDKVRAAAACGAKAVVIRRPLAEEGVSVEKCLSYLSQRFGFTAVPKQEITILGLGAGSRGSMTLEAEQACENAELIIGAKRITDSLSRFGKPVKNAVAAKEIETILRESGKNRIVVAMSGDSGFYSGTKGLLPLISDLKPTVLPGISSVSELSAKTGVSWDDAVLISAHGRRCNYVLKIRRNKKVIALVGGEGGAARFISDLCAYGLSDVSVTVAENLSYSNEKITKGTAKELSGQSFDSLAILLIENPSAEKTNSHGRADEDFIRTEVPMTKQEVRSVTLSKLQLRSDDVCWDVGAGTGSVSIEMAECCEDGEVYAIEQKEEACRLIEENKRHLGLANVNVVFGTAPGCLSDLPAPDRVFVGGSSGNLREILSLILTKNPSARIVLNTVTAETFAEAVEAIRELPVKNAEIVTLNVSRSRKLGRYHLMTAQNPVSILSLDGGACE